MKVVQSAVCESITVSSMWKHYSQQYVKSLQSAVRESITVSSMWKHCSQRYVKVSRHYVWVHRCNSWDCPMKWKRSKLLGSHGDLLCNWVLPGSGERTVFRVTKVTATLTRLLTLQQAGCGLNPSGNGRTRDFLCPPNKRSHDLIWPYNGVSHDLIWSDNMRSDYRVMVAVLTV